MIRRRKVVAWRWLRRKSNHGNTNFLVTAGSDGSAIGNGNLFCGVSPAWLIPKDFVCLSI
jgi:hypothetical protein